MTYISSSESMDRQDDWYVDSSECLETMKEPDSTSVKAVVNSTPIARTLSTRPLKRSTEEASLPSTGPKRKRATKRERLSTTIFNASYNNAFHLRSESQKTRVVALSSECSLSKTELEGAILVSSGWPDKREKQSPFLKLLRLAEKNYWGKGWMRKLLFGSRDAQPKTRVLAEPERESLVRHMDILKRITHRLAASDVDMRSLVGVAWNIAPGTICNLEWKARTKHQSTHSSPAISETLGSPSQLQRATLGSRTASKPD
jgi:hypothetical protein